jgi:PAS domain S-box-containing protein
MANGKKTSAGREEQLIARVQGRLPKTQAEIEQLLRELTIRQVEMETRNDELKRKLEESEASRTKYFGLYDLAPVGYVTCDEQGIILEANRTASALLGVPRDALTRRPISRFILPEDRDIYLLMQKHCTETGIGQIWEMRMLRPDGSFFWAELQSADLRNNNDAPIVYQITLTAIDRHKQAEAEIIREKSLLRCIIDSVGDLIYIKDMNGVYRACNKASEAFVGLSESDQIGKTDFDFFDRDIAEAIQEFDQQILASGKECRIEEWVTYRDGSRGLLDSVKAPYFGPEGEQLGLVGISRDITERKRMEKALHDSEEQFRTLCNAAPIGIFRSDSEGNANYFNPRWEEITGIPAAEGLGKGWLKGIHPDDLETLGKSWQEAEATGRNISQEHRQLTPQGDTVWVRALASPIYGPDGTILSQVGTLEDITELRQARQEMLKAVKLESLGVLAGGIAHDFNNILTAVFGNISLARFQLHDSEAVHKRLTDAENAIVRAADLTKQLLTFARGGEPVKKIIKVNDLLQDSARFLLHGSKVDCEFRLDDGIWPVEADEGQLAQVIHNLVLNAVQAMPQGGKLMVQAHNIGSPIKVNRSVKISVADTGTGIAEQTLQRIFDPYFTTKPQGNGLGLATCYSIINKHGGKIRVESTVGKGTTFIISLPASDRECESKPKFSAKLSHGSGRVLVMDDNEDIRSTARVILTELGYTVELTENGAEAVELYLQRKEQGTPFSAVILDLTIPGGMGGKETLEKLIDIDPAIKAIVSSGYSNDPVMANHREHGFSAVLSKPYLPQEMGMVLLGLI